MELSKNAKVTLVGAGPGAEDLITVRGLRILQNADVILYDALVSDELLSQIRTEIPKIYIGKRCGLHSHTQEKINELIVTYAFKYGHVVRLKGGDPFVFGRANEEIEYVEAFGIPVSSSFWVMTATKRDGSFSQDLVYASRSSTTMVILMGVRKLHQIVDEVSKYRDIMTPIALIQNGTTENERCIVATLETIKNHSADIVMELPGIIVIGDVVADHPTFFEEEVQRVLRCSF